VAHEDFITLAGQTFHVEGPVLGKPGSEWTTGLKVGKATYDERVHAFYLVMDDFSGGFGRRRTDIRVNPDTFFESDGVDLRRAGHVTLPPARSSASPALNPTGNDMRIRVPSYPWRAIGPRGADPTANWGYIVGFGSGIYTSTDNGVTWVRKLAGGADAAECGAIIEFIKADATVLHFAFFASETGALTGTARYQKSTDNGATWSNGAVDKVLHDAYLWNNKTLLAAWGRSIIFSTDGDAWNIDDALDATFIANVPAGHITFIGSAMAPWGEPAVYFHNGIDLYALDFFARRPVPIPVGIGVFISGGVIWNGSVVVTDGWNVYQYNPGFNETVRNIGFARKDGLPSYMLNAFITKLFTFGTYLGALVTDGTHMYVFVYSGRGWSQLGSKIASSFSHMVFEADWRSAVNPWIIDRKLHVWAAATPTTAAPAIHVIDLPNASDLPLYGTDSFEDGPLTVITGWLDGGFREVDGTLYYMMIDAFNLSTDENVKVEYRLDNSEGAFTQMVDSSNVADTFTALSKRLYFSATTPKKGIQFRTVQFRFTLDRGSTATKSPEVLGLILVYDKKPNLRTIWTMKIDVCRMKEAGILVDGVAATYQNVWQKLRDIWNTKPLVQLDVPNTQTGMLVRLADMALTSDDFRDAVQGSGNITITCLEPVA